MTGAGSSELLFSHEQALGGALVDSDSSGDPELYSPGRNPTLSELNLERQLQRLREAGAVESVESAAQNLEGAVSVGAVVSSDVHAEVEQHVFNDGGAGFVAGRPNSAAYFVECDYLSGTASRKLIGCIPLSYSVTYEQGGMVRYSLSMAYQDEESSVTIPTADVTRVSDGTSVPFHGFDLSIDGTSVDLLQSATISIDAISRFQRGASYIAEDAVIAAPVTELSMEAIFSGPSRQELAYGSAGATSTSASMSSVAATATLNVGGTTVSTYNMSSVKPDTYSWNDLIDAENDTTESVTFHVNDGIGVA